MRVERKENYVNIQRELKEKAYASGPIFIVWLVNNDVGEKYLTIISGIKIEHRERALQEAGNPIIGFMKDNISWKMECVSSLFTIRKMIKKHVHNH